LADRQASGAEIMPIVEVAQRGTLLLLYLLPRLAIEALALSIGQRETDFPPLIGTQAVIAVSRSSFLLS
jgi:hypothetical protein